MGGQPLVRGKKSGIREGACGENALEQKGAEGPSSRNVPIMRGRGGLIMRLSPDGGHQKTLDGLSDEKTSSLFIKVQG